MTRNRKAAGEGAPALQHDPGNCRAGLPRPAATIPCADRGQPRKLAKDKPALPQREHLRRLPRVFARSRAPLFFLTICAGGRRAILTNPAVVEVLVRAWEEAQTMHGWTVGRFVVMPDHVHFFATPASDTAKSLSAFIECWKRWTRRAIRESGLSSFAWQAEFFDHLMRSTESYTEKWEYVRLNPVRAGLVVHGDDWPYQGEIHSLRW